MFPEVVYYGFAKCYLSCSVVTTHKHIQYLLIKRYLALAFIPTCLYFYF